MFILPGIVRQAVSPKTSGSGTSGSILCTTAIMDSRHPATEFTVFFTPRRQKAKSRGAVRDVIH